MKQVRLTIDFYNSHAGDVVLLKDHSADDFVRLGWAVYVKSDEPKPESEPIKPVETVKKTRGKR